MLAVTHWCVAAGFEASVTCLEHKILCSQLEQQLQEIQSLTRKLERQAMRDPLTGLHNRRFLKESLARELAAAKSGEYELAVVLLDIDHFKQINDNFGHDSGDRMLKELGDLLHSQMRRGDIACRYGGEEFVLVMPEISMDVAYGRMEALRIAFENVHEPILRHGHFGSISVGIALYPSHGVTIQDLITTADRALYVAKNTGRNRVHLAIKPSATKIDIAGFFSN